MSVKVPLNGRNPINKDRATVSIIPNTDESFWFEYNLSFVKWAYFDFSFNVIIVTKIKNAVKYEAAASILLSF
jgi:hypothetical protein